MLSLNLEEVSQLYFFCTIIQKKKKRLRVPLWYITLLGAFWTWKWIWIWIWIWIWNLSLNLNSIWFHLEFEFGFGFEFVSFFFGFIKYHNSLTQFDWYGTESTTQLSRYKCKTHIEKKIVLTFFVVVVSIDKTKT